MKTFQVVAILMLLTAPASAQGINLLTEKPPQTEEDRAKEKAIDEAYKAKMNRIPDQKASSDPWATVRTPDTPKNVQTTRKPNPK
jgi:hypothetical protein